MIVRRRLGMRLGLTGADIVTGWWTVTLVCILEQVPVLVGD